MQRALRFRSAGELRNSLLSAAMKARFATRAPREAKQPLDALAGVEHDQIRRQRAHAVEPCDDCRGVRASPRCRPVGSAARCTAPLEQAREHVELTRFWNGDDPTCEQRRRESAGVLIGVSGRWRPPTAVERPPGPGATAFKRGNFTIVPGCTRSRFKSGLYCRSNHTGTLYVRCRQYPQRLAGLDDVRFDRLDLVRGEEVALLLLVVGHASSARTSRRRSRPGPA